MGTFMETNAAIILTVPIFLPIVTALGVSPVHFGIVTIVNLAIGFVTPPLGANLFMASAIGNVPLNKLSKDIWPWIAMGVVALLAITYIPELILFLPKMLGYGVWPITVKNSNAQNNPASIGGVIFVIEIFGVPG